MQKADTPDFGHRVIFYTSAAIVAQGRKGFTYSINPVYSIILTDFDLKWFSKRLIHEVLFMERSSGEVYTEDVKMMFISLRQVKKEWSECSTELERLLYLIKNIHTMDKNNELYRSGDYSDVFEAATLGSLAEEERVEYSKSYWKMKDDEAALEYAKQQAIAEGRAEGRAEGMENGMKKGMEKGILQTALKLLKAGVPKDLICQTTGLTPEQLSLG